MLYLRACVLLIAYIVLLLVTCSSEVQKVQEGGVFFFWILDFVSVSRYLYVFFLSFSSFSFLFFLFFCFTLMKKHSKNRVLKLGISL